MTKGTVVRSHRGRAVFSPHGNDRATVSRSFFGLFLPRLVCEFTEVRKRIPLYELQCELVKRGCDP